MKVFGKIGSWFAIRDEEEEEFFEHQPPVVDSGSGKRNVVPLDPSRRSGGSSVAVFAPRTFADVTDIADALRARQVAILNLQTADRGLLQRVVDFTAGVAYTIDGRIQKLADAIYLVVPAGVMVNAANLREQVDQDGMLDLSGKNGAQR